MPAPAPPDPPLIRRPDAAAIAAAAHHLREGRLVAFPTETVYGLGGDAGNDRAIAAVFAAKGRPQFNPLIVHVEDGAQVEPLAHLNDRAIQLIERFWPGPLTLVLPRRETAPLSLLVSAGLPTVALRAPAHPVAQALIRATGLPIAAPSANPSGCLSPSQAEHVAGLGHQLAMVLDGGPCRIGIESTVLDLSVDPPQLLRPGGLAVEAIEAVIGALDRSERTDDERPRAPGMLSRHYAPAHKLRLNAHQAAPGEAFLGFGPVTENARLNLSRHGDLEEAAANLFAMLWALDRSEAISIAVAPIPEIGLGRAINDRLRRAATPAEPADWNDERGPAIPCMLPGDDEEDDTAGFALPRPPADLT